VGGAFDVSFEEEFELDPLRTAEEIHASGLDVLRWIEALATADRPRPVDVNLVTEIHRRWFETTFPSDAGRIRSSLVVNRKGTAVPVEAILPAVVEACDTWSWRQEHAAPGDDARWLATARGPSRRGR
jgi:hypothetical protein